MKQQCLEPPKHQEIRLVDVFMVGPLMMYTGLRKSELHPAARLTSTLVGFGTIVFNGLNWLYIHKKYKKAERLGLIGKCR